MTSDHHSNDCNCYIYNKVLGFMSLCWIWVFFFCYLVIKLLGFFLFPPQQFFEDIGHILQRHILLKATPCWLTKGKKWIENIIFCQLTPGPGNNPGYLCSSVDILLCSALHKTKQKGGSSETAFNLLLTWKRCIWIINKTEDSLKIFAIITYLWPQYFPF